MTNNIDPQQIDDFLTLFDNDSVAAIAAIRNHTQQNHSAPHTTPTSGIVISTRSLTKTYKINKQRIAALHDITLDIHTGEFIALTGVSGSGKSTLLQLIGGLDQPSSGTITVDGIDINHLSDAKRSAFRNKTIGFVFQFFYLQPFLRIAKNIEVPGMFSHTPQALRRKRIGELIEKVGLNGQESHLPKQLSGGQIQRTAIARALLNNPKILLADEPTGNLDSTNSKMIIDLFKRIREELGTTIVIVTHNPEIAAQADREIRLSDGEIV